MQSRRDRIYASLPEPVTGYELNPIKGLFSVIIPEATQNLVINPSMENGDITGYNSYNALAFASTDDWQAYGAYALAIEPDVGLESGFYYSGVALTAGVTYTASITIQGLAGELYYIGFRTAAGAALGTARSYVMTGHKQRIHVTYTETANNTRRIYVYRSPLALTNSLISMFVDGLQVEAKSYPTTYCDGSLSGFLVNESPAPYLWSGIEHASTSTRSSQTRSGGREVNILDLGFRVLAVIGLGFAAIVDQSLPIPGLGELPQGTGTMAREFTLVGAVESNGPRHLQAIRSNLIDAFKPDLVTNDQPLILRYIPYDEDEDQYGESLDIVAKYRTGLEGNWDNHHQERIPLTFKMYLPFLRSTFQTGTALDYQTTVANANYILMRSAAGVWAEMAGGANNSVVTIAIAPNGLVYIGGAFTNLGDANGDHIVTWNGTAYASLLSGAPDTVRAITIDQNGLVYVGGDFINLGDANGDYIVTWNGVAWASLGTGGAGGVGVEAIAFGIDGSVYVAGTFTSMGGVANTSRIAKWNPATSTWSALGTGMDNVVTSLVVAPDGTLYAGGGFTTAGGVSAIGIAKWDGSNWSSLGVTQSTVYALAIGPDGTLYAGGNFLAMGGVADTARIASWNGVIWQSLHAGLDNTCYRLIFNRVLYASGAFTTVTGSPTLPDSLAFWNGSYWSPMDVNLPGADVVWTMAFDRTGILYIGFSTSGNAISATVSPGVSGSSKTWPIVTFYGPGRVWQLINYTTNKKIFFNLTLLDGETAVLNLDPLHFSFRSNFRGNIASTILPASNLNFELLPGNNNVSAYMFGSTGANTAIEMTWNDQYWSIDGAAWQ